MLRNKAINKKYVLTFSFLLSLVASSISALPSYADNYPSWGDVENAKQNVSNKKAVIEQIESLIGHLQTNADSTIADARKKTQAFLDVQEQYEAASRKVSDFENKVKQKATEVTLAQKLAGNMAVELYQQGGENLTTNTIFSGNKKAESEKLLTKLGMLDELLTYNSKVYKKAQVSENVLENLRKSADVAKKEMSVLKDKSEKVFLEAQKAQRKVQAELNASQNKKIKLEQQLKFLKDKYATTAEQYKRGEEERSRPPQPPADNPPPPPSNGGGGKSTSSWVVPAYGPITDVFGPRDPICAAGGCSSGFHAGTDIGTGCAAPIYAAHSGTVTYSGWHGTYGNYIKIEHDGTISTAYGHIMDGGLSVSYGQSVSAGQVIASSGSTGASTGCHLHYEVWQNGLRIDPVPFMIAHGAPLG